MPLIMSSRYYSKEIFQKDTWRWNLRRESSSTIFNDFDPEQIFLPNLLSQNGYRTAIIHDHWWFLPQTDFVGWFDEFFQIQSSQPTDEEIVGKAIEWMERNRDSPFFLYLHIMSPHQPYPPKPADVKFIGGENLDLASEVRAKFQAKPNESCQGWSEREIQMLRALYDGNLRHSDSWIGTLYSQLEKWSIAENTLFIVTSDHGEHLGEHNHLNHGGTPFDSGIHIPLIMIWPGKIPAGTRVKGLCGSIDILPTIVDLCSLKVPPGKIFDGLSLRAFIQDPGRGKEAVYAQTYIRTTSHKLIPDEDDSLLFDIATDQRETNNLAEKSPEIKRRLGVRHEDYMRPFQQRYQAARKPLPPDYPFYLPLKEFDFTPREFIEYCSLGQGPAAALKMFSPVKPWVLNRTDHQSGLFCLPALGEPGRFKISTAVPSGPYRILTLVEILGSGRQSSLEDVGLRIRLPSEDFFRLPLTASPLKGARYIYLDWGEFTVEKNRFEIELLADPSAEPFFIHLVRFDPYSASSEDKYPPAEGEEIKRRKEGLRSLGYL